MLSMQPWWLGDREAVVCCPLCMGGVVLEGLSASPEICSGGSSPTLCGMREMWRRVSLRLELFGDSYWWYRREGLGRVRALYWAWHWETKDKEPGEQ